MAWQTWRGPPGHYSKRAAAFFLASTPCLVSVEHLYVSTRSPGPRFPREHEMCKEDAAA